MSPSFKEVTAKNKNLAVLCVISGLIYGLILGVLIIGNLFVLTPSVLIAMFTGIGCYIMWSVCIVLAVLLTCFVVHKIKKTNKVIKEFAETLEKN